MDNLVKKFQTETLGPLGIEFPVFIEQKMEPPIWALRRDLSAFRRIGCQAVHLIDQLARGLNTVLQAFVLRASYVDVGIAPTGKS